MQIILAIFAFGMLVIAHEFGHFITAKRSGVQVNEFWIGMGPAILRHEWHGTTYCLRLLPFGGACVMEGEDSDSNSEHSFQKAKLPQRMLIVAAGALMNFLIGFLLVLIALRPTGPTDGFVVPTLESVNPASSAAAPGGLQAGDEVLKVGGYRILLRSDFNIALQKQTDPVYEVVVKRDGKRVTLPMVRLEPTIEDESRHKLIGLNFVEEPDSIGLRLRIAGYTSLNYARLVWDSLAQLVTGKVSVNQLSGPVGVTEVMADTARQSFLSFLHLVAFISINLGVMNLLPLPALDGGRLVFLVVEGIRRKPVPPLYEGYVHAAGLALLLTLMIYVTGQDIWRLLTR